MVRQKLTFIAFTFFALAFSFSINLEAKSKKKKSKAPIETMFEGYYKIKMGDLHVGYTIQRYSYDPNKQQFTCTYYIKTKKEAGGIDESLIAVANNKFEPVSYQYTAKVGKAIKMIDAQFKNGKMTASIGDGKRQRKIEKPVPKSIFLSSFLGYMILQKGYSVGKSFSYKAIAEEDTRIHDGEAFLKETVDYKGHKVFRVLNTFKGSQFTSFVTGKAEVLHTKSIVQKISTELVSSAAEATQGLIVPAKSLKLLFKTIPRGTKNIFHPEKPKAIATSLPDKKEFKSKEKEPGQKKKTKGK